MRKELFQISFSKLDGTVRLARIPVAKKRFYFWKEIVIVSRPASNKKLQDVVNYYSRLGSRLGYRLVMKKSQHFGIYTELTRTEREAQKNFSEQFGELLELRKGMNVLDAGCGQGVLAVDFAKKYEVTITGITIVPLEVKKSQRLAKKFGVESRTDFIEGDYHKLPFPDNTFDCIYAVETLSHAYDLKVAVQELYRVLKPGGLFVAAEYEFDFNNTENGALANQIAKYVESNASIHAVRDFKKGNFVKILTNTGYSNLNEYDWTERLMRSFIRLRSIGKPYKKIVKLLGREAQHPNAIASSFYADGTEAGIFRYIVYKTTKRKSRA